MAGSAMTFEYDGSPDHFGVRALRKVVIAWTSDDTDGTCAGTTAKISGELVKAVTDPGATAPTDDYDIVITDEEGVDVLAACVAAGRLANRDTANSEQAYFFVENVDASPLAMGVHPVVHDKLTISISNAGNSKVGQIILYVR